jgi:hypothetical protein
MGKKEAPVDLVDIAFGEMTKAVAGEVDKEMIGGFKEKPTPPSNVGRGDIGIKKYIIDGDFGIDLVNACYWSAIIIGVLFVIGVITIIALLVPKLTIALVILYIISFIVGKYFRKKHNVDFTETTDSIYDHNDDNYY